MTAGLPDVVGGIIMSLPVLMLLLLCCMSCPDKEEEEDVDAGRAAARSHPHPPPAPAVVKMELGHFPYAAAVQGGASSMVCAICLDVLVEGATCSEVPACRHMFHRECIQLWMKSKNTCPLCRDLIVPGAEPLSAGEDMV